MLKFSTSTRLLALTHMKKQMSALSTLATTEVLGAPVADLVAQFKEANIKRGAVYTQDGSIHSTHAVLDPVADFFRADTVDFNDHEAFFFEIHPETDALMGVCLWRTVRGQGAGGIRLRGDYDTLEDYVRDGLRLAIGMGRKNALAGLWWGGGKGVIGADDPLSLTLDEREGLLESYGRLITSLRGSYVAAEDVGICVADMDCAFRTTRYTTCISPALGGSGNPSVPTAHGVVAAMEGALDYCGAGTLEGKTVAVQGLGNVGGPMVGILLERGVKAVLGADIDPGRVEAAASLGSRVDARLVGDGDDPNGILFEAADIVSPCGFGGVLNADTVPRIQAPIVCGAANNQLLDPSQDYGMQKHNITYVPDFVANRMGIVNCANEQYGRVGSLQELADPAITQHLGRDWENSVFRATRRVLEQADALGVSTNESAEQLADKMTFQPHPIWGHRSKAIVEQLLRDGWACE